MSEFDAAIGMFTLFFIGLTVGYVWAWTDAMRKMEDKEWVSK